MDILSLQFLSSLLSIIMIDIVLGGDNAILIALATRNLNQKQRKKAVFWGVFGAIAVRATLTAIAVYVLKIPFIKFVGGILLVWIAYKLLIEEDKHNDVKSGDNTFAAIKTIVIADVLMGIDNVLAVAGAAHGHPLLVILGLLISVPIIVWGSGIIFHFIERFPIIIFIGGAVIAWTAGKMIAEDDFIHRAIVSQLPLLDLIIPISITALVVIMGYWKKNASASYNKV
ncbi:TerC family protein [Tepidibacillus fermentans]|uniref:YjbE family integral membrane protein n=1 Tax=Tepidibacillus fermentans TaxID=1281767 RepID=A0A4R3K6F4_9BACI|nr:TerC family protein [Tepidibacillus fermentans]TCS78357.1 YjbE family integral membrane protein [Tepidibacillus fermentans]